MAAQSSPRAVLFDALGTLVGFEPPAPHLRAALRERLGVDVGEAAAAAAIRAEIAYYRAHLHEGSDPAALVDLRRRCAEAMRPELRMAPVSGSLRTRSDTNPVSGSVLASSDLARRYPPVDLLLEALMVSLRFFAYPDSAPALEALRVAGIRTAVVSNWDWSLHERLAETGLAELVDGAVASAEIGSAKPDGAVFRAALDLVGAAPEHAWHVGDTPEADVEGARAAGLRPVLIARDGRVPAAPGVPVIASLAELIPLAVH
jgi:putative hydrolase of the HAD superfamily